MEDKIGAKTERKKRETNILDINPIISPFHQEWTVLEEEFSKDIVEFNNIIN